MDSENLIHRRANSTLHFRLVIFVLNFVGACKATGRGGWAGIDLHDLHRKS